MRIKITDFGQARPFVLTPQKYTLGVQALFYRAPELLLGCPQYSEKIDLWSIGCVVVMSMFNIS
jgi:serine/threonine protein kinase